VKNIDFVLIVASQPLCGLTVFSVAFPKLFVRVAFLESSSFTLVLKTVLIIFAWGIRQLACISMPLINGAPCLRKCDMEHSMDILKIGFSPLSIFKVIVKGESNEMYE
jgi:hypothetical protein